MIKDFNVNLPKKNIIFYLLCFGGIIAFYIISIMPEAKILKQKNLQIKLLESNIKKQEKLFPFYEILTEENKRLNKYDMLNSSEIEKCDSQDVMDAINKKCQNNLINIIEFKPIITTLDDNSEHLSFSIEMHGKLANLNSLLKEIAMLACVEHIEKIDLEKNDMESDLLTHKLNLLLHGAENSQMQAKGN